MPRAPVDGGHFNKDHGTPMGGVVFVRLIKDHQLVGIFHNVSRDWLGSWADTVANTDLCEYAVIDTLVMVWPGPTSPVPYPPGYCVAEDDEGSTGYPGALLESPTEKALADAVWQPLEPGEFVYFAAAGDRVKIGKANDVTKRLATLQTGCPFKIKLLRVERGGIAMEREYHRQFASLRETGEWFRHEGALAEFLAGSR